MAQANYGGTNLHVTDLNMNQHKKTINETEVIGDPTTPNAVNTAISGIGYKRSRYTVKGWCTLAEYLLLKTKYEAQSSNTLTVYFEGTPVVNELCIIDDLQIDTKAGERKLNISISFISG